jgi:hypothetical protein
MLNYRNKLFNENEFKIEYLTFEYLFDVKWSSWSSGNLMFKNFINNNNNNEEK